jgi:hypothetical protein
MRRTIFAVIILLVSLRMMAQDATAERQIFELLNGERVAHGLKPLEFNSKLAAVAEQHSVLMILHHGLSHQFADEADPTARMVRSGVHFDSTGENVATAKDAASAHDGLMNSPPHRANILNPKFTAVGIGVVRSENAVYVTQDFVRAVPEYSVEQAERRIVDFVTSLRRSAGRLPLPLIQQPELRKHACAMAKENLISMAKVRTLPNVSTTVVFTTADLSTMPQSLEPLKMASGSGMSVGVCYAVAPSNSIPQYWVAVVTYF